MDWDFEQTSAALRYKLLVGLVVPRPIALVTSVSESGVVNAAPFSFFNVLGDDPPILIVSVEDRDSGGPKDTTRNIVRAGEFVVNLVDEAIVSQMHGCSEDYPPEVSEVDMVGFTTAASRAVIPPRIAQAPVALECRLHTKLDMPGRHLFIGQVLWLHAREGIVDPQTQRVQLDSYHPVGRMFANRYVRTGDQFEVDSNSYNERRKALGKI
jgi:flavin reductase (DIM6/NTAB) family NADH-FMN oxidoreductase RutF